MKTKALEALHELLEIGSVVYSVCVNSGSRSRRQYIFLRVNDNHEIIDITHWVALVIDQKRTKHGNLAGDDHDVVALLSIRLRYEHNGLCLQRIN